MHFLQYLLFDWEPQYLCVAFSGIFWFWFFYKGAKKKKSDTTEKSRGQDWCFCPFTCRSVGLLLQAFIHWVILIQVYDNVSLKEEYRGFVRIKTSRKSISTPSWAVPCCGTRLQPWCWCCSPKVSSHELLWQCEWRRSTRVSLPLIFLNTLVEVNTNDDVQGITCPRVTSSRQASAL